MFDAPIGERETATGEKGAVSERRKQQPREEEAALTTHRQYSKAEKDTKGEEGQGGSRESPRSDGNKITSDFIMILKKHSGE